MSKHRKSKIKKEEVLDIFLVDLLRMKVQTREHIYGHIKQLHDKELALLEEARADLARYLGQK